MAVNLRYLFQIQLARQHYHIGKLRVEAQGLHVRDIQLGTEMHFLANLPCITHHSHVCRNHGGDAGSLCRIHDGAHQRKVLVVNNGIDGKIAFHPVLITRPRNFP